MSQILRLLPLLAGTTLLHSVANAAAPSDLSQLDFFEKKIRPVLADHCYKCHSAQSEKLRGGLLLDSREGVLKGGDSGPAILPGNPQKSLLIASIRHEHKDPDMAMPPKADKLSEAVIADLEAWIAMGAPDPRSGSTIARGSSWDPVKAAAHWAFQPLSKPALPPLPPQTSPHPIPSHPIDAFVQATLAEKNLAPSPLADRHTLIRRVTYDLTGLPPTPQEVSDFLSDPSPNAFEKVIDRLLASPRYGERWARHWLDVARYADTSGDRANVRNRSPLYPNAWTYRDYVIQAFNQDLPYDQFLREQIAADRLPESKDDPSKLAALGFLTIGKRFMANENDIIDDRIDVVTKGLMGLTGACARCHDHKFDPIPTRDYYALHGIFASSEEPASAPILSDATSHPAHPEYLAEVQKIQMELHTFERSEALRLTTGMLEKAGDYLLLLHHIAQTQDPAKRGAAVRAQARQRGLDPEIAALWAEALRDTESARPKRKDPILEPWFQFAALPEAQFEERSFELFDTWNASNDFNPTLLQAFLTKAPHQLEDVANAYTETFASLAKTLNLPASSAKSAKDFPIAKLETPLQEEPLELLRKDVFRKGSALLPDNRTLTRVLGVRFSNTQAAIQGKLVALDLAHPGAPIRAMALVDKAKPRDSEVLIRGEALNKGPTVPRHFLTALGGSENHPFTQGSGRLELAQAISSRDNPLTARVIVNRIWQWHFGQGIVRTVSDFGTRSEPPSHPELLDWLASTFVEQGWSLKKLHKLILLSHAYQQDSRATEASKALDPNNQWLSHFNLQRLDLEQVRDTLLSISGQLDTQTLGGRPFRLGASNPQGPRRPSMNANPSALQNDIPRRTLYALIDRSALPDVFNTFDFANPDISTGERTLTTVPQQALFLLNSPFVAARVRAIQNRPDFPRLGSDEDKVRFLYDIAFQRAPSRAELEQAFEFLRGESDQAIESNHLLPIPLDSALRTKTKAQPSLPEKPLTSWERYMQVVLLANELMYIR